MAKGRAGRPKHDGERTASGQLSRSKEALEGRASIDTVAQQRAQKISVLGDIGQGIDLSDPIAVLEAQGHLTAEQASAGSEIARLHRSLFERARIKSVLGGSSHGSGPSEETEAAWRSRYERALKVVGASGGHAVSIVRLVCCAHELPIWAGRRASVTIDPKTDKLIGARPLDRKVFRAMMAQLPPLRRALSACADGGIVAAKKGRG